MLPLLLLPFKTRVTANAEVSLTAAGVNNGRTIRMGVFTDYQKVRPTAPIAWKANGATTLVSLLMTTIIGPLTT